jgi:hypothetical protein
MQVRRLGKTAAVQSCNGVEDRFVHRQNASSRGDRVPRDVDVVYLPGYPAERGLTEFS